MHVDVESKKYLEQTMGIKVLSTEIGLNTFKIGLSLDKDQIIVMEGDVEKIKNLLNISNTIKQIK